MLFRSELELPPQKTPARQVVLQQVVLQQVVLQQVVLQQVVLQRGRQLGVLRRTIQNQVPQPKTPRPIAL